MTVRVLVVDDSALMRNMVSNLLGGDPEIQVVGTARNGRDAVHKVATLQPDVVTLDIEMPEMNGLEALQFIMAERPTPVVMFSSLTTRGAEATLQALSFGAIDFVAKPGVGADMNLVGQELINKVKMASKVNVQRSRRISTPLSTNPTMTPSVKLRSSRGAVTHIVGMGTSTGGPQALEAVLKALPGSLPCAIPIVQHMPATFTRSLAQRLNGLCEFQVVEAEDGQPLENGVAYIAPGGRHMEVTYRQGRFLVILHDGPKQNEHRPSVDVLFESIAALSEVERSLVLMTGMGSDGAVGMRAGKLRGITTIAESERTCVVYGMPKAAISMGCVDYVLPVDEIGRKVVDLVQTKRGS